MDSRPEETRRAVAAIRRVSKQALADLRAELAALRGDDGDPAMRTPTPGLSAVSDLVARMREAGLAVDLQLPDDAHALPDMVGAAAYRIVQ